MSDNLNFIVACQKSDLEKIKALLSPRKFLFFTFPSKININAQDHHEETGLHHAAKNGHKETVEFFIRNSADVSLRNFGKETPLHLAVENGNEEIAKLLIEAGADVNTMDMFDKTPLHIAAEKGNKELIKMLIKYGACNSAKSLYCAVENKNKAVAELLIGLGADVNTKTPHGNTPLHCAVENSDEAMVKLLIKNKAHLNIKNNEGKTPLHIAAIYGKENIAKTLISQKAALNVKCDNYGQTPLLFAAHNGHKKIVEMLIDHGANMNIPQGDKETPLLTALKTGHTEIAKLLIEKGADVDISNKRGTTPLWVAESNSFNEIVTLIKEEPEKNLLSSVNITGQNSLVDEDYIRSIFDFENSDQIEDRRYWDIPEFEKIPIIFDQKRFSEIEERLQASLSQYKDYYFVYTWLAKTKEAMGEIDKAREILKEGLKESKMKNYLYGQLAMLEYEHGRLSEAIKYWIRSASLQIANNSIDNEQSFLYLSLIAKFIKENPAAEKLKEYSAQGFSGSINLNTNGQKKLIAKLNAGYSSEINKAIRILVDEH